MGVHCIHHYEKRMSENVASLNCDENGLHPTGASGKNVFCTVFPFAPQPFVHGKWESNEVGLRSDSVRSTLHSVVDTVGKSGILPRACFHPK
jgi:hypothetical protein